MRSRLTIWLAMFTYLASLSGCGRVPRISISADRCYLLLYGQSSADKPSQLFAQFVALEPGIDSGEVRSGPDRGDTTGFWRMFEVGGHWQRDSTDLVIRFSNGSSDVVYRFSPASAQTLKGEMRFLYDVVDQRPPPIPVAGLHIRCEDAHLESPVKVAA